MLNVFSVRKTILGWSEPPRPRTNEAIITVQPNGDAKRFEFDYDENNFYVYTGTWPADWPNGRGCKEQLPVRVIPRRKAVA